MVFSIPGNILKIHHYILLERQRLTILSYLGILKARLSISTCFKNELFFNGIIACCLWWNL